MHTFGLHFPAAVLLAVSTAAHAAAAGKACDLVSKGTAEKLFGGSLKTVTDMPMANDGSAGLCVYQNSDREQVNFHFQIRTEIPDTMTDSVLKTLIHKGYPSDVVEKIPGVGDDNFFITSVGTPNSDTFTVLYHKAYVTLIVSGSKDKDLKADMVQVMKQVLAKL
jgi:hypothetical protein